MKAPAAHPMMQTLHSTSGARNAATMHAIMQTLRAVTQTLHAVTQTVPFAKSKTQCFTKMYFCCSGAQKC